MILNFTNACKTVPCFTAHISFMFRNVISKTMHTTNKYNIDSKRKSVSTWMMLMVSSLFSIVWFAWFSWACCVRSKKLTFFVIFSSSLFETRHTQKKFSLKQRLLKRRSHLVSVFFFFQSKQRYLMNISYLQTKIIRLFSASFCFCLKK